LAKTELKVAKLNVAKIALNVAKGMYSLELLMMGGKTVRNM